MTWALSRQPLWCLAHAMWIVRVISAHRDDLFRGLGPVGEFSAISICGIEAAYVAVGPD